MARFYPEPVPYTDDMAFIREFLGRQFNLVLAAFEAIEQIELEQLAMEPERPREGMIKFADGTNWDPGGGKGFYGYDGTIWRKLDEIGTAAGVQIGSWTPALNFGGATTGITYTTQRGTYIKIGQLVFIEFEILLSSKGSATGSADIGGLPFPGSSSNQGGITPGIYGNLALTAGTVLNLHVFGDLAGNGIRCRMAGNANSTATATDANFTATSRIAASGCYKTAA